MFDPMEATLIRYYLALYNCVFGFILIVIATPQLAVLAPFLVALLWSIQRIYLRTSRQIRRIELEINAPLCTHIIETMSGILTIRAFGWKESFQHKNLELLNNTQVPWYLLYSVQNWLRLVLELIVAGLIVIFVLFTVALRKSLKIEPAFVGLALVGAMDLGFLSAHLITAWTALETNLTAVTRIREFAQETPLEEDIDPSHEPPQAWPDSGCIKFENVSAGYSPNLPVVRNINLNINAGEKIGICGRTGSGKSSLLSALFNLLHITSGEISIDGISIASVPVEYLRSKLVAIPQEPFFINDTIRRNFSLTHSNDCVINQNEFDEKVIHALKMVGLWEEFEIQAQLTGASSVLDLSSTQALERLSQGQKQLFCLARAVASSGKIIVLDEATSRSVYHCTTTLNFKQTLIWFTSIDPTTATLMHEIVLKAFEHKTVVVVAHQLSSIMEFDYVIVMSEGSIIETGKPGILKNTEGSVFREMIDSEGVA
jgi:ATP-binding cassette subfamily C (CFTR/MRP) protein 1